MLVEADWLRLLRQWNVSVVVLGRLGLDVAVIAALANIAEHAAVGPGLRRVVPGFQTSAVMMAGLFLLELVLIFGDDADKPHEDEDKNAKEDGNNDGRSISGFLADLVGCSFVRGAKETLNLGVACVELRSVLAGVDKVLLIVKQLPDFDRSDDDERKQANPEHVRVEAD